MPEQLSALPGRGLFASVAGTVTALACALAVGIVICSISTAASTDDMFAMI